MTTLKTFPRMTLAYNYLRAEERTKRELLAIIKDLYQKNPEGFKLFYKQELKALAEYFSLPTRGGTPLAILKEISEIPDLEQSVISEEPEYSGRDMYTEFTLRNLSRRDLQLVAKEVRDRSGVGVKLNTSSLALIRYILGEQTDYYRMAKIKFAIKGTNIWRHDNYFYANSLTYSTRHFRTAKAMYFWLEENLGNLTK